MNKRLLGGLLAAGIIGGGVYGFAATLDVTTDNLGANSAAVLECDADGVELDYTVVWSAEATEYVVDDVVVRDIEGCADDTIAVTLTGAADNSLGEEVDETATLGTMNLDFADQDIPAKSVENVHIAIAGGDADPA